MRTPEQLEQIADTVYVLGTLTAVSGFSRKNTLVGLLIDLSDSELMSVARMVTAKKEGHHASR
jgi:hypothetical protein